MTWAIWYTDEDSDNTIIGPFPTEKAAKIWAANDAEEKAGPHPRLINATCEGDEVWLGDDDDATCTWSIRQMVKP